MVAVFYIFALAIICLIFLIALFVFLERHGEALFVRLRILKAGDTKKKRQSNR